MDNKYEEDDEVLLLLNDVELDKLCHDDEEDDESDEKRDEAVQTPKFSRNVISYSELPDQLKEVKTIDNDPSRTMTLQEMIQIRKNEKKKKREQQREEAESRKPDRAKILAGGDFLVQVHIIEGRDLKGKDGAIPHPVATISIFDDKKSTKIKDTTSTPLWDQRLYFELSKLEPDQLSQGKALIQVFDSKWSLGSSIMAKELIGAFEFDLSWIYFREHHEVYNEWIPLMNYQGAEGNGGIRGYLKMCITVLGPGDEQHTHDEEEEQEEESGMTLVSPSIEQLLVGTQTPYFLTIRIYEAGNITSSEKEIDVFFYVKFAGHQISSKPSIRIAPRQRMGEWIEFEIPVMEPVFSKNIEICIMDDNSYYEDVRRRDECLTTLLIDYAKLKKDYQCHMKPQWLYAYGAQPGRRRRASKMNQGLIEGTHFRGALLVECKVHKERFKEENEDDLLKHLYKRTVLRSKCRRRKPDEDEKDENWWGKIAKNPSNLEHQPRIPLPMIEYCLQVDLYEGAEINKFKRKGTQKAFVMVSINDYKQEVTARSESKPIGTANSRVQWYQRCWDVQKKWYGATGSLSKSDSSESIGPFSLPKDWEKDPLIVVPDVLIYLYIDDQPVAYRRVPLREISKVNDEKESEEDDADEDPHDPQWYTMKKNKPLNKYKDDVFPGELFMALNCVRDPASKVETALERVPLLKDEKKESETGFFWTTKELEMPKQKDSEKFVQLRVHCYRARSLRNADFLSMSDPFMEARFCGEEQKTQTKQDNNDPEWNRTLLFKVPRDMFHEDSFEMKFRHKIYCEIFDEDTGKRSDSLGRFCVDPHDMSTSLEKAKWYKLEDADGRPVDGEVLAAFEFVKESSLPAARPLDEVRKDWGPLDEIRKDWGTQWAHIITLGLRDIQNMLGVNKPFIEFECSGQTEPIKESNFPSSRNPNFGQVSDLVIPWPDNMREHGIFLPNLNLTMKDSLFGGLIERQLGIASVMIKDLAEEKLGKPSKYRVIEEEEEMRKIRQDVNSERSCKVIVQCYEAKHLPKMDSDNKSDRFVEIKIGDVVKKTEKFDSKPNQQWNDGQGLQLEFENCEIGDILKVRIKKNIDQDLNEKLCFIKATKLDGINNRKWIPLLPSDEAMETMEMEIEIGITYQQISVESKEEEREEEEKQEEEKNEGCDVITALQVAASTVENIFKGLAPVTSTSTQLQPLNNTAEITGNEKSGNDGNRFCCKRPNRNAGKRPSDQQQNCECYDMEWKSKNGTEGIIAEYMENRETVDDELEDAMTRDAIDGRKKLLFPKTFLQIGLRASSGIRAGCTVGYWKGLIEFTKRQEDPISDLSTRIMNEIKNPLTLQLRLYILRAIKLMPKDPDGTSDPYLVIKIGKQEVSTRNDYIADTLDPEFYYSVQIPVKMPGPSKLDIEVWDWDGIGDDLIGRTTIDIEDRWYNEQWHKLRSKTARFKKLEDGTFVIDDRNELPKKDWKMPVETRSLWTDESPVSQGKLQLWMELLTTKEAKKCPMTDIQPPEKGKYELRVIVWECANCPEMDSLTNANDLYVTAELETSVEEEADRQQTDIHFRSRNGRGAFNWRMKFPIKLPQRRGKKTRLKLQVWDKDIFSADDFIAEVSIPLTDFLKFGESKNIEMDVDKRCVYTKDKEQEFWLQLKTNKKASLFKVFKCDPKIRLSIELLPMKIVKQMPAGSGRDAPNTNPFLPFPEGRTQIDFRYLMNPFKGLRWILGDRLCLKIGCLSLMLGLAVLIYNLTPMLLSNIFANMVTE